MKASRLSASCCWSTTHVRMNSTVYLKCLEDTVTYVPDISQQHETIGVTYRSVALHHLKVTSGDGSIIPFPSTLYSL